MADKDQYNDEYQFADLDAMTPDAGDEGEGEGNVIGDESNTHEGAQSVAASSGVNNIKRNAVIVVVLVIIIMIIYKFMGSVFSEKKVSVQTSTPTAPITAPVQQKALTQPSPPVSTTPVPITTAPNADTQINQKLSALEVGQQSMRTDVSSVNSQISGINTNLNALVAKITELDSVITNLNTKLDDQTRIIEQLTIRREVKKVHYAPRRRGTPSLKYYIQAVIPGRAWLIATNGSTLTVREGTTIAGYGMVKLIDPNQGRITTSSGQVIRFSQEDS
jgi:intracellular multiplication protein IcmG